MYIRSCAAERRRSLDYLGCHGAERRIFSDYLCSCSAERRQFLDHPLSPQLQKAQLGANGPGQGNPKAQKEQMR